MHNVMLYMNSIEQRLEKLREKQQIELSKLVIKHAKQRGALIEKLSKIEAKKQYKEEHKK